MSSLRIYQRQAIAFAHEHRRSIIALDPGLGKSAVAISAATLPALVMCPAGVRRHWADEIRKWHPSASTTGFQIVGYADPELDRLAAGPSHHRTVIADEAHYLKSPGALRSRRACALLRRAAKAIALTGTPMPNRPIELWPLLYSLRITDLTYLQFAYRYADAHEDDAGRLDVRGASNLEDLRLLLAPHMFRRTKSEVMRDLPPKTWRVLALDLPVDAREKELVRADLGGRPVPFEALSDIRKLHGTRKAPAVAEHVQDLLAGGEPKVIVFAHHREVIAQLYHLLEDFQPTVLVGSMTDAARAQAVAAFQEDPFCRVIVCQIQAGGIGINLTAARRVVFAEADWVPANLVQAADRCHRHGQEGHVVVDLLTIHDSLDEYQLRRCLEKVRVIEAVIPGGVIAAEDDPLA